MGESCSVMWMQPPYGPIKIGANRQITLPADLLRQIDLAPHDSVYVIKADDTEDTLTVVPVEILVRWLEAGRRLDMQRTPIEDTKNS